jgi:hypothetical protein
MCPTHIGKNALRPEVVRTDALAQSDFPTAKHRQGERESSASSCPHFHRLPSSCAEIIVSGTSLVGSNCYTVWMESTQPTRGDATAAHVLSMPF